MHSVQRSAAAQKRATSPPSAHLKSKPPKKDMRKPDETRLSRGRARPGAIFPVAPSTASLPESYAATLQEIKTHLRGARIRAVLAANPVVIEAYWRTGKIILARQQDAGWGARVIDRLAADLQAEFPDMGGLTRRNLFSTRAFAEAFPDDPIVKKPVSQLPCGHIIRLLQMVKDPAWMESTTSQIRVVCCQESPTPSKVENELLSFSDPP